jgi:hypothetical protein
VLHIPNPPRSPNLARRRHPCPLAKGCCCHCPLAKGCCCHAVSACTRPPPPPTPFSSFPREPEPAATPRPHFLFPFSTQCRNRACPIVVFLFPVRVFTEPKPSTIALILLRHCVTPQSTEVCRPLAEIMQGHRRCRPLLW